MKISPDTPIKSLTSTQVGKINPEMISNTGYAIALIDGVYYLSSFVSTGVCIRLNPNKTINDVWKCVEAIHSLAAS
jgi:hypothetical protein